ncbi:MAG: hypothetical protein ACKO23_17860, partial [Gemmataceae bacterium]
DIDQARQNLQKNQMAQAAESMQQAAQDLAQAAQQLAQNNAPGRNAQQPSQSSEMGAEGGGSLDPRVLPGELAPYAGKRWGELPGELRTKIVQQMKARYGEDYARMIKLYFEQIADIRKKSP